MQDYSFYIIFSLVIHNNLNIIMLLTIFCCQSTFEILLIILI